MNVHAHTDWPSADETAKKLGGKKSKNGYVARCPAHQDKNPSLSISEGRDGRVVFKCHTGCSQDAVMDALRDLGLFGGDGSRQPQGAWGHDFNDAPRQAPPKPKPEPEETWGPWQFVDPPYDYTDAAGNLVFQVRRKERFSATGKKEKSFAQQHPDGNGGWIHTQGDQRVLYRWPGLIAYPEATLFVCEGEKDADRLTQMGLVATTVANGNWKGVDVKDVVGREAWVLEDADKAGVKRALESATALGNVFARSFMSSLLADGGVGKTAVRYAQLLSAALGRSLTGEYVFQRCRVLIVSLEDDEAELKRRILALLLHYGIDRSELVGWLFLCAPGGRRGKIMTLDKKGNPVRGPLADDIEAVIVARKIDIVSIDPFVKSHSVEENSNSGIDDVVQVMTDLAAKYDIAIDVPHHTSKGVGDPGNANRGRGASAMKDGARLVYTLTPMSLDEAKAFGIPEDQRRSLIRMDSGKVNIAPPMRSAKWFRLVGVRLDNGNALYPNGDEVQAVEAWEPPDTWAGLHSQLLNQILTVIDAGLPDGSRYTSAPNAGERAAWQVVVEHAPDKTEAQAREVIKTWMKNGVLVTSEYHNPVTRKPAKGLRLDSTKRPS